MSKPKCFDDSYLKYLSLFGRRRKRSDDFFGNDDWFNEDENEFESNECENLNLPNLTSTQIAGLLPLAEKYKSEGFSLDVGRFLKALR